jgi:hypothetical protein
MLSLGELTFKKRKRKKKFYHPAERFVNLSCYKKISAEKMH